VRQIRSAKELIQEIVANPTPEKLRSRALVGMSKVKTLK
jgi:hypothetical protein